MKKTVKKAGASNRATLEDIGNKEWRFVEIPYEGIEVMSWVAVRGVKPGDYLF